MEISRNWIKPNTRIGVNFRAIPINTIHLFQDFQINFILFIFDSKHFIHIFSLFLSLYLALSEYKYTLHSQNAEAFALTSFSDVHLLIGNVRFSTFRLNNMKGTFSKFHISYLRIKNCNNPWFQTNEKPNTLWIFYKLIGNIIYFRYFKWTTTEEENTHKCADRFVWVLGNVSSSEMFDRFEFSNWNHIIYSEQTEPIALRL